VVALKYVHLADGVRCSFGCRSAGAE